MTDVEANSAPEQAERKPSSEPDPNHPLPLRAMAHKQPKPADISRTDDEKAAGNGKEREDAVGQLAEALQTAKRSHRAYLAELRQSSDVQPAEDWSTWYAEYLLGLR